MTLIRRAALLRLSNIDLRKKLAGMDSSSSVRIYVLVFVLFFCFFTSISCVTLLFSVSFLFFYDYHQMFSVHLLISFFSMYNIK